MELTITQNGALYFAHHKVPKRRAALFWPFRTASKQRPDFSAIDLRKRVKLAAAFRYKQFVACIRREG
jgi:hypothetical protein